MAKDKEQMTMEEYLLSQLDTPVTLKDGSVATKPDGSAMTKTGLSVPVNREAA